MGNIQNLKPLTVTIYRYRRNCQTDDSKHNMKGIHERNRRHTVILAVSFRNTVIQETNVTTVDNQAMQHTK